MFKKCVDIFAGCQESWEILRFFNVPVATAKQV